jgi:hypothetical protein
VPPNASKIQFTAGLATISVGAYLSYYEQGIPPLNVFQVIFAPDRQLPMTGFRFNASQGVTTSPGYLEGPVATAIANPTPGTWRFWTECNGYNTYIATNITIELWA